MRATSGLPPARGRTSSLPSRSRATVILGRAENAVPSSGRRVDARSVTEQQTLAVEAVEQPSESSVRLQRCEHRAGGVPVAVAVEIARDQPGTEGQESG